MKRFRRRALCAAVLISFSPLAAQEHTVTFTITGKVISGIDAGGIFGTVGPLTAQPFTLVFAFDETKGENQTTSACSGPPSRLDGSAERSPGTATLQIGNSAPHKFDTGPGPTVSSWAERKLEDCCFYIAIGVKSGNDYITSQLHGDVKNLTTASADPQAWNSAFPELPLSKDSTTAFMITNTRTGTPAVASLSPEKVSLQLPPCGSRASGLVSPLKLRPQELPNWCWAATTQMLAENATGNTSGIYEQCQILEKFFPANNCCQRNPSTEKLINTDPRTCGHTGIVQSGLEKLDLTSTVGTTAGIGFRLLSEEEMKREISCKNRLVGFEWIQRTTGLLHDMVILGYQTGSKGFSVCVFDPQSAVYPHQDRFTISYKDLMDPSGSDEPRIQRFRELRFLFYDVRPIGH